MQKFFNIIAKIVVLSMCCHAAHATSIPPHPIYDHYPKSIAYYHGQTVQNALTRIFQGEINRWPEQTNTVELAYTLSPDNTIRQFFYPVVGVVQIAGNITLRDGKNQHNPIYEFDPYLIFRFTSFPWNDYVPTSLAIGEGISYTSAIPSLEQKDNNRTKRLLNFLMLEATFSHPSYPQLQLLTRIHHRSGAYGLYRAGNTGSNELSIGIRYLFD